MDWRLFKKTYPYVCNKCGYFHWEMKLICEGCGNRNTLRKTSKKDWTRYRTTEKVYLASSSILK